MNRFHLIIGALSLFVLGMAFCLSSKTSKAQDAEMIFQRCAGPITVTPPTDEQCAKDADQICVGKCIKYGSYKTKKCVFAFTLSSCSMNKTKVVIVPTFTCDCTDRGAGQKLNVCICGGNFLPSAPVTMTVRSC